MRTKEYPESEKDQLLWMCQCKYCAAYFIGVKDDQYCGCKLRAK